MTGHLPKNSQQGLNELVVLLYQTGREMERLSQYCVGRVSILRQSSTRITTGSNWPSTWAVPFLSVTPRPGGTLDLWSTDRDSFLITHSWWQQKPEDEISRPNLDGVTNEHGNFSSVSGAVDNGATAQGSSVGTRRRVSRLRRHV